MFKIKIRPSLTTKFILNDWEQLKKMEMKGKDLMQMF